MPAWVIGHNLAGYMPESDTYAYADRADAARALIDLMRDYADRDDDAAYEWLPADAHDDDHPTMLATVNSLIADRDGPDGNGITGDWGYVIEDACGRPISFWLMWSPDRDPDSDDE